MNPKAPSLLLLIPAYNEEQRIEPVLREYVQFFRQNYTGDVQIVVVLNGCVDNTLGVVRRVAEEHPQLSWLDFPERIGKGGALIEGLKLAPLADLIGYVDADGATSPKAFLDLLKLWDKAECIVASRWLPGAVLYQQQSGRRQFASRVFHLIVQTLFRLNVKDTQCGAKIMRREVVEAIHSSLRIADMAFDINLLYAIKRAGFRILEVPTEWTDKMGSKVVLGRTSLSMLLSVIRLRLYHSPIYPFLTPFRPLEGWIYMKLKSPAPLRTEKKASPEKKTEKTSWDTDFTH